MNSCLNPSVSLSYFLDHQTPTWFLLSVPIYLTGSWFSLLSISVKVDPSSISTQSCPNPPLSIFHISSGFCPYRSHNFGVITGELSSFFISRKDSETHSIASLGYYCYLVMLPNVISLLFLFENPLHKSNQWLFFFHKLDFPHSVYTRLFFASTALYTWH